MCVCEGGGSGGGSGSVCVSKVCVRGGGGAGGVVCVWGGDLRELGGLCVCMGIFMSWGGGCVCVREALKGGGGGWEDSVLGEWGSAARRCRAGMGGLLAAVPPGVGRAPRPISPPPRVAGPRSCARGPGAGGAEPRGGEEGWGGAGGSPGARAPSWERSGVGGDRPGRGGAGGRGCGGCRPRSRSPRAAPRPVP